MKRILSICVILVLSIRIFAQPDEVNESFRTHGVQSVSMFRIANGEKQLLQRKCYNAAGQNVSNMYVTHNKKEKIIEHDTFIIHSPDYYSCIAFDRNPVYDSTNSRIVHGTCDTLIKDCYQKGKIVFHDVYISDSLPRKRYMETPGKKYSATIHTWDYEYDDQGFLKRLEETDTIASDNQRSLKWGYGYTASSGPQFELRRHYKFDDSTNRVTHWSYIMNDKTSVNTIMYNEKEETDYSFSEVPDKRGQDSISVQRDAKGNITNRNVTTYGGQYEKTDHYDSSGALWKTDEKWFDENNLLISIVETYIKTDIMAPNHQPGEVEKIVFEYGYF